MVENWSNLLHGNLPKSTVDIELGSWQLGKGDIDFAEKVASPQDSCVVLSGFRATATIPVHQGIRTSIFEMTKAFWQGGVKYSKH